MWIAENLSKNSINKPTAESGNVVMSEIGNNAIIASGEHPSYRKPYGMMGENSWGMPLPLHKGKKAIVVSTCTTPYPFNILYNQTHGVVPMRQEKL